MQFEDLSESNQHEARTLILAGLAERWGELDESLNPDLDDMMSYYGDGHTVLVRSDAGVVVGTGTLMPRDASVAEIVRMSVAQETRRTGVGARIVEELIAVAREWQIERVVLETNTDWTSAVRFYLNCGFSITRTEDGPFGGDTWFERVV